MALTPSMVTSSSKSWLRSTLNVKRGGTNNQLNISTEHTQASKDAAGDNHIPAMALPSTSSNAKLPRFKTPSHSHNSNHASVQLAKPSQRLAVAGMR